MAQASERSFPIVFHTENCAVHSGNPTVSSVYLPTITMASSQGTSVSSNSFSRWASHDIFLSKYHFLLHILRFIFFLSDNILADVASTQQTTALFLSTRVTRTRRHTELTKMTTNLMGNLCCAREHSVQLWVQYFYTVKLHSLTEGVWGPYRCLCYCMQDRLCVPPVQLGSEDCQTRLFIEQATFA